VFAVALLLLVQTGVGGADRGAGIAPVLAQNATIDQQIRSPDLAIAYPAIASRTAEIRGLAPREDVPRVMQTPADFRARTVEDLNRPDSLEEIENSRKLLVALGLLAPDMDLYALELQFRSGVVLGQYDPDTKQLYVITDAAAPGPMERITLAHEYTHALQDQYYDIRSLMPKNSDNSDRDLAASALMEGDAVLMEELFQNLVFTSQERAEKRREEQALGSGLDLDRIPLVIREETYFPYVEGPRFIFTVAGQDAIRNVLQTGRGYGALVNRIFENPPRSSAQVIHPEKYLAGVNPVDVQFPDLAAALGDGWKQLRKDLLGEIDHRILVQQFLNRERGEQVSAGWAGDAFALLGKGDEVAVVVSSRWDSPGAANDWYSAYTQVVEARYGGRQQVVEQSADRVVWRTPDGMQALRRSGTSTTILIAQTPDEIARLDQALGAATPAAARLMVPQVGLP
jgi:hypothetical protein